MSNSERLQLSNKETYERKNDSSKRMNRRMALLQENRSTNQEKTAETDKLGVRKLRNKNEERIGKKIEAQMVPGFVCPTCGAIFASEMEWGDHNTLVHRPI